MEKASKRSPGMCNYPINPTCQFRGILGFFRAAQIRIDWRKDPCSSDLRVSVQEAGGEQPLAWG